MAEWIPAQGYCFDGRVFQRATTNTKDIIVNKETGEVVSVQAGLLLWYTRREMTNAVATLLAQPNAPAFDALHTIAPLPELMAVLEAQKAKPMLTQQHIYRMLTNGRTRVLGRPLTEAEKDGFELKAKHMTGRLEAAQIAAQKEAKIA